MTTLTEETGTSTGGVDGNPPPVNFKLRDDSCGEKGTGTLKIGKIKSTKNTMLRLQIKQPLDIHFFKAF